MSATPGREKNKAKRSYAKPAMKRVHLKPEEAVLGGCKTSDTSGPTHPSKCNVPIACSTLTS
jgi:hypothetical protein